MWVFLSGNLVYYADDLLHAVCDYASRVVLGPPRWTQPISDLSFNDGQSQLLYRRRGDSIFSIFQNIENLAELPGEVQPETFKNTYMTEYTFDLDGAISIRVSIDVPFFAKHGTTTTYCFRQYLALGITKDHKAYLMMTETQCLPDECAHVLNDDPARRFAHWTIVGRLLGYKEPTNSLGSVISASQTGRRIAIATWNTIRVWVINPDVFFYGMAYEYYPERFWFDDHVQLPPIILRLDAVCFKLRFTENEDELLAITDRGVMYWNLGRLGRARRSVERLQLPEATSGNLQQESPLARST